MSTDRGQNGYMYDVLFYGDMLVLRLILQGNMISMGLTCKLLVSMQ